MIRSIVAAGLLLWMCPVGVAGAPAVNATTAPAPAVLAPLDAIYPDLEALYVDLHRNPELSNQEARTAARLAEQLRALGFDVTTGVGGHGVVGLMRNGPGPTVMLRTDLDALPVEEKTGLPYASTAKATNASGETVAVMHACGHDIHMTAWLGAATLLSRAKDRWRGTLLMVGQPAEELGGGARAMLEDGLFIRFPRPDFAFALHDSATLPSGQIGWRVGAILASSDSVDITVYGKGGHGASPQTTVDPVVVAAKIVLALQTIVSRENDPLDPAVVTVGSIHGGTKHNIIPDDVRLQLTVRTYREDVRRRVLASIERIARGEAEASGTPKPPKVTVSDGVAPTSNDAALAQRLAGALARGLGADRVVEVPPIMAAEDFSEYGRAGVPAAIFWVGAVPPERYAEAKAKGETLPSLHSARFAPDPGPTIKTGVSALALAALELLAPAGR